MHRHSLGMAANATDRRSGWLAGWNNWRIVLGVAMALACGLGNRALFAQTPTATLTGLIQDESGALVPEANLTLTNTGTSISRTTRSGNDGYYTFSLLLPGTYQLAVEHAGFETLVRKDIRLSVQETVRLNLNLQVGATAQEVTVTASALTLRKVSHHGVVREWTLNPVWVQLDRIVHEEFGIERLFLVSRGRRLQIAGFLSPDEKASFARALSAALGEAKRGPTRTTFE